MKMKGISKDAARHLAVLVGRKANLQVIYGGNQACTDFKRIYLPNGDNFDEDYRKLLMGFIIHEPGHVMHSSQDNIAKIHDLHGPLGTTILNIFEDVRMERKQCRIFPGAHEFLHDTVKVMIEKGQLGGMPEDDSKPVLAMVINWLRNSCRARVMRQDSLLPSSEAYEVFCRKHFGDSLVDSLANLISLLDTDGMSTDEVFKLSCDACDLLKQAKEEAENNLKQESENDSDDSDESDDSETGSGSGAEEEDNDEVGKQSESESESEGNGVDSSDETSDDNPTEDDGQGGSPGESESKESESAVEPSLPDESDGTEDAGSSEPNSIPGGQNSSPRSNEEQAQDSNKAEMDLDSDPEVVSDISDVLSELLEDEAVQHGYSDPEVLTVSSRPCDYRDASLANTLDYLNKYQGVFTHKVVAALEAMADSRSYLNQDKGRLSLRHIDNLINRSGGFLLRQERQIVPNTACAFVLDHSGSMHEHASEAMALTLSFMKAVEVVDGNDTALFTFGSDFHMAKGFGERTTDSKCELASRSPFGGNTPSGTATKIALDELIQHSDRERKVLFLITDGRTHEHELLTEQVQRAKSVGVDVVGIGFGRGGKSAVESIEGLRAVSAGDITQLSDQLTELLIAA